MEGHEISIIQKSELERTLRIDSEFYAKENLVIEDILRLHETANVAKLTRVSDGNHMSISEKFTDEGIPYYRGQDIHNFFIEQSNPICIDEETYNFPYMKRSHLKKGDVLLSIVGTIGGVSLVSKEEPATCNCKLAILRPNKIDGFYLYVFLRSRYGQNQIKKFTRGAVQMGLILEDMDQILVPVLSVDLQNKIHSLIVLAYEKLEDSKMLYKSSEDLLLEVVGLKDFEPSKEPVNIKSFSYSFLTSGRLDAEYYQTKYEGFENVIKGFDGGFTYIGEEFKLVKNNSTKSQEYYNYIEIGDVNVNDGSVTYNKIMTEDLPANAKIEVEKGDILISKVRPNRGAVTIIDFTTENLIVSGAFTVLREKEESVFSNETLKVLLRTNIYKEWLLKFNVGTQYPVIRDEDVLNLPIPKIDSSIQVAVKEKVRHSQELKKQSEILLEVAKQAVEIAIEQNETAAINFIDQF